MGQGSAATGDVLVTATQTARPRRCRHRGRITACFAQRCRGGRRPQGSGTGPCPHEHARLSHRRCKAAFAVRREWQPPEQQPPMPMPIGLLHARDALQLAPAQARAAHALSGATKAHGCASPRDAFCEICGTRSRVNSVLYIILYSRPVYISETIYKQTIWRGVKL